MKNKVMIGTIFYITYILFVLFIFFGGDQGAEDAGFLDLSGVVYAIGILFLIVGTLLYVVSLLLIYAYHRGRGTFIRFLLVTGCVLVAAACAIAGIVYWG